MICGLLITVIQAYNLTGSFYQSLLSMKNNIIYNCGYEKIYNHSIFEFDSYSKGTHSSYFPLLYKLKLDMILLIYSKSINRQINVI